MNKFNHNFNNACARFSFWNAVVCYLFGFEKFLNEQDILTSEDKVSLRKIHERLYECNEESKARQEIYRDKMNLLIGGKL